MLRNRPAAAPIGITGGSPRGFTKRKATRRKNGKRGGRKANGQFKRKGR